MSMGGLDQRDVSPCRFTQPFDGMSPSMPVFSSLKIKLVEEECETCEPELTEEIVPRFICSTRVSAECRGGPDEVSMVARWL